MPSEPPVRFYDTLLGTLSDLGEGVVVLEGESFLYSNAAFARMVGYEIDALLAPSFTIRMLFAPEVREDMEERLHRRLSGKSPQEHYETTLLRRDGARVHVEISVRPLRLDETGLRFAVLRDVTARREAEAAAERARKEAAESEKLAAVGSLVSGVAHELRTPLVYIQNSTEILRTRVEKLSAGTAAPGEVMPAVTAAVHDIAEGADRINRLVRDLSRYTRLPVNDFALASLDEVVQDAVRLWEGTHRGINVQIVPDLQRTTRVPVDRAKFQQIVLNLVTNAAEALPHGGRVFVATSSAAGGARLVIRDEGIGMTPEVQAHMFDPLYSTKPEGMGLGLSIVRRVVELHRGAIECASTPGEGTSFIVTLPA